MDAPMQKQSAYPLLAKLAKATIRMDGTRKQAIETGRNRLLVTAAAFAIVFCALAARLVELTVNAAGDEPRIASVTNARDGADRANIVDRNGIMLATSLPTASLYANPRQMLDVERAAERLAEVLPDLNSTELTQRLRRDSSFVWIKRHLTPNQVYDVNALGIPGLQFQRSERRVYPSGAELSHVLGLTDVDGRGIAGIERAFERELTATSNAAGPLALSVDLRVQHIVRDELISAVNEFKAKGAAGVVLDARTGEVLAMVSLPDFDPNQPLSAKGESAFNRVTKGVYEMGSTFKLFTAAAALDAGSTTMRGGYDAREPIRISRFTISDYHPQKRWLSVTEILVHSSNIGAAKMALDLSTPKLRKYLEAFGLLERSTIELPEIGRPLMPQPWREINTMTIAFGHGIAVTPLQMTAAIGALVNGGILVEPTVLRRYSGEQVKGVRVISEQTSRDIRSMMRLIVTEGTAKKADVKGYRVGGKTGTAEKIEGKHYGRSLLVSSFVGAFPIDQPRYVVLVLVDEPKGNKRTFGYATGGWVAAPVMAGIVQRMAPVLGIGPEVSAELTAGNRLLVAVNEDKPLAAGGRRAPQ